MPPETNPLTSSQDFGLVSPEDFGQTSSEAPLQRIANDDEFKALQPGTKFIDPEGQTRYKPIENDADFFALPEGATFMAPDGQLRVKPTFEGIDYTAQTLYDMSVTDSEKRKALERSYPGMVQQDDQGLFVVDKEGKHRRPGRGLNAATGFVTAAVAPVVGAVLGTIGGGAAGSTVPGAGTFAGGAAGAVAGGVMGQSINDIVLQLSGVYDRSLGEEAANLAKTGMMSAAGMGVGRGIATMVPAAKAGVSSVSQMLPSIANKFLGTGPELTAARELAEKGVMVPPSAVFHEAPHLQNIVEVFDPAFRTNKPLQESAVGHFEKSAKTVLDDLGVKYEGKVTEPTVAVPTQRAGEKILERTLNESAQADEQLRLALEQRKAQVLSGAPAQEAQRETVLKAAEKSRSEAQKLIDLGFREIEDDANKAMKLAGSGANTGDLWDNIGNKLYAVRRGIAERANYWYDRFDEMTGGYAPSVRGLSERAQQVIDELPEDFQKRYPGEVAKLSKLAGVRGEDGEWLKEPVTVTMAELQRLRSLFRDNADWYTLSSDFKNGVWKLFSKEIDDLIHSPNLPPNIRSSVQFLDMVDNWYRENIRVFNAQQIKAVMKGLEAGEPADPANLYRAVVKEGHTDLTRRIRDMVGPNLWAGVKAADTRAALDASKTLNPGEIDARKFAREILERHRNGTLQVVHEGDAEKLLKQARAIEQLDGRLPIPANPQDSMTQVIARARLAGEEAKALGVKDPIKMLEREMKQIERDHRRQAGQIAKQKRTDPLGFLYDPTTGATEAVNKILGSEDLILAAAARFGEKSPEFNMLRQVYVEKILRGGLELGKRLEKVSEEIQQLMFPGVTRNQMRTLADEMKLLLETRANVGGDTAGGMAAMARVENPVSGTPVARGAAKMIPGLNPAARAIKGKYYELITDLMTRPATLRWLEKGLNSSNPEEIAAVREILRQHLQKGSAMGAGGGAAIEQYGLER